MRRIHPRLTGLLLAGAALAGPSVGLAHPVTVNGSASEWLTRLPNVNNVGLIARNPSGYGELIWRDATADTRTDLAMPEAVGDITAFQVTADPTGVGFLLRRAPGVSLALPPIQVQIAIDIDRVDGSGQDAFGEFADTFVASNARWERLVVTLFGSGGTAKVVDTDFAVVEMVQAQQTTSLVEIFVPWSALGLAGPPATPLRFTVATFRAKDTDITLDIGGGMVSNAVDAVTNYANPASTAYPNTSVEVGDQIVDHFLDVYFTPAGEVYAPLVVQKYVPSPSFGSADEWYTVKNMTPAALPLAGFKVGDEETPDGVEGMYSLPDTAVLAAGASFTVARAGTAYETFFGAPPDAELPGGGTAAPDMLAFTPWTNGAAGTFLLGNFGDEVVVLDPSSTILDIAVFGSGGYTGILSFTPAPATDEVLTRKLDSTDTDSCVADFSNAGKMCTADAQCAGPCFQCAGGACEPKPQGVACPDADPCNGDEICDGLGACVTSPDPPCHDMNPCTTDSCAPVTGCAHDNVPAGTSCSDGSVCNGDEVCDAAGACLPGVSLDCDDGDPCTTDACDPAAGCSNDVAPAGTDCSDADPCNGAETCDAAGVCAAGTPLDCDDGDPCTTDTCDTASGCQYAVADDDTPCGDGDACNGDETCIAGVCSAGMPLDCNDQNDCTVDLCDAEIGCAHVNTLQGAPCEDGNSCTQPDTCDGMGTCVSGPDGCGGAGGGTGGGGTGGGGTGGSGGTGGTGGTPATGGAAAGSGGDGGTGGEPAPGGCGCRVAGSGDRTNDLAWLATLAMAAAFVRRRRPAA